MLTAKLAGEGFAKPNAEAELPIDINYAKMSEWLVDRKQVPSDWNRKLQAIQAKASEAVRELPAGFLGQFEGGDEAPLDYFQARQVLVKLSETAEKSLLGSLKGAAGAWEKIVKAYEYNLIYVAEAAQALCRNADYEIPFLKKQAAKYQQQLTDLERRKAEAHKSAAAAAADFQRECQALGIDSGNIRGGLLGLTAELPALAGAAVEALQAEGVTQGLRYYLSAVAGGQQQQQQGSGAQADVLPVLQEVREGRTEPPAASAQVPAAEAAANGGGAAADSSSSTGLQVDWDLGAALQVVGGGQPGDGEAAEQSAAGISWDLDASDLAAAQESASGGGGISWDVEAAPLELAEAGAGADEVAAAAHSAPVEISWDIGISGVGEETEQQEQRQAAGVSGSAQAAAAENSSAAAGTAAPIDEPATVRRLVEDASYRGRLLDDLFELRAFLIQRGRELSGRGSELLMASAPDAAQHVSSDMAASMLEAADAALAQFSGDKLKQLIALRTSGHYLERLVAELQQKAAQEGKFKKAAAEAEVRRGEVQRQLMADSARLAATVKRTRQAKEEVERALSAKLGRRINIMGEVNQLL